MYLALFNVCLLASVSLVRGDDIQLLSSASTDFSQRLYQKIALSNQSAVYSPFSIHSALAMTTLGARGETATELSKTLGLTQLVGDAAHKAYHDLIVSLNSVKDVKLNTANALFVNPNVPIEATFVKDVQTDYLATTANFDLAAAEGPEKSINDFVENKTEGLIKNLLPKGSVNSLTTTILINTIFFNGTWETTFLQSRTRKLNFQKLGGTNTEIDFLYDERFVYIKRNVNGVNVAELPFKGERFSLYIALPQAVNGITALENSLTAAGNVDQFFEGLSPAKVKLSIPKFKIESKFGLNAALKQLGLVKPFDRASANFKGISSTENLYISDVVHKAVIEVKETGTVAAAATGIVISLPSIPKPATETFIADHPFMFFLRDTQTREILFQGKFLA